MNLLTLIAASVVAAIIGLTVLVMVALRRVVPTNMVHIVQSKKATTSYGKGRTSGNVYYEIPSFVPLFGVTVTKLPESVFDVNLPNYDAYDKGRLPFLVDVLGFFRISDSDVAAHRVASFEELLEQLSFIVKGAVRSVLAKAELETIMQDRAALGQAFTDEIEPQLIEWGVQTVKPIEFMDIKDTTGSQVIHQIMAKEKSRIERESREAVAENNRSASEREIEAKRQIDLSSQQAAQAVGERTAEAEKVVGIAREQSRQEVLAQARTTAEREMQVKQVNDVKAAEIARQVAEVKAAQDKNVAVVSAEAAREQEIIAAEATKQRTTLVAEGDLNAAKNNAEGIQVEGVARASAEKAMQLAPVEAQIVLAKEIGSNESYQKYLVTVRNIEAGQQVGMEMAKAIGDADLKVIANSGDIVGGVASITDLFSTKGGTSVAGLLEAISQTPAGAALVERVTGHVAEEKQPRARRVPTANSTPT